MSGILMLYNNGEMKMYLPEDFKENDFEEIKAIVEQFPFATCVANIGNDF